MKRVTIKIPPGKRVVVIQLIAADNEGGLERVIDYYDGEGVQKSQDTLANANKKSRIQAKGARNGRNQTPPR